MFALDIETVPLTEALDAPYPRDEFAPPSNYKNPEVIDGWYVKDEARWRASRVKTCSLNPRLGRIVALGAQMVDGGTAILARTVEDEPRLLRAFWSRADTAIAEGEPHLITWNGAFDLHFLLVRSLIHGLVVPPACAAAIAGWRRKYDLRTHFDVKAALLNFDARATGEGLDEWATCFGLPTKPMHGSDVYLAASQGEWEDIRAYVMHDVTTTHALYYRIRAMFPAEVR